MRSFNTEAGPMAQNDDDLIVLPPPPKKVFEVVDVDSSGEEGETVDATFPSIFTFLLRFF